jgi:hypothetical protein
VRCSSKWGLVLLWPSRSRCGKSWAKLMRLRLLKSGDEYWLHVQTHPVISDEIRAGFRRMDEDLRQILYFQERRRRAAARKRSRLPM